LSSDATLTITQLASHLGVSRWKVSRLIHAGELPSIPGGRGPLVPIGDYLTWFRSQVVTPDQEDGDMSIAALPDLIPFEQVAEKWGLSLRGLKEGARARKFAHIHIGHDRYFTGAQLDAFLAARTVASAEDDAKDAMRARRDRRQPARGRRAAA
jgi:excisionase family DNA binding protein